MSEFSEEIETKMLLLEKLFDYLCFLINQKQSKIMMYWSTCEFFCEFILKQRNLSVLALCLKIIFKILKFRSRSPELIRIMFGTQLEPLLGFMFALKLGPVLGQFSSFACDLLQDPDLIKGIIFYYFQFDYFLMIEFFKVYSRLKNNNKLKLIFYSNHY